MPRIYRQHCKLCGRFYKGIGTLFCSRKCNFEYRHGKVYKDNKKICSGCKEIKNVDCFYIRSDRSKGKALFSLCIKCSIKRRQDYSKTAEGIWSLIKKRDCNITKNDFINWYNKQNKICVYCGIPLEIWLQLYSQQYNKSAKRLTIDRMNNYLGYEINNIVLSCYKCNSTKNDFLTYNEMIEIGDKYIRPKWQNKLKNIMEVLPWVGEQK